MERLVLLINHVLSSESVATDRLRPHSGRRVKVDLARWPSLLPPVPDLTFVITPAGLLEWAGAEPASDAPADLRVNVDMANPALVMVQGLVGERPAIDITGDARLAADVSWLFDNLRWDIEDDLARVVGQVPAREMARFGHMLAAGLRQVVRSVAGAAGRSGGASAPSADPPAR